MEGSVYRGVVIEGSRRARELGYPTLNIKLEDSTISGVFAARVVLDGALYKAAAFADPSRTLLEAHLLDFADDAYGKEITVELLEKIRDAHRFENDEMLKAAIASDVAHVRDHLS